MFQINVRSLARVYVPECGNVGPAQATGEGGFLTKKSFLVSAQNIIVCKALSTLYLTCDGHQPREEAEETGTEKLSDLGKVTQQPHSRAMPFPSIFGSQVTSGI